MTKTAIAAELRRIGPALVLLQALLPVLPARALPAALPHTTTAETSDPAWFARDTIPFDLPAQPLHQALTRYAEQAGVQLFYRREQLPTQVSPLIRGQGSPRAVIAQLLADTGLDFRLGNNRTLVISAPLPGTADSASAIAPQETANPMRPLEETYVTGVRTSLRQSLATKYASENLVEITTAEDIGKFPDHNVADALQRIAGVSVDRVWGEGRDVNIRGTDKDINRTLLNGQHVASAYWWANDNLSRGFNYATLASQLVQSLEVHKTPRADLDEGSIGGTVIVRTRKPLDMESRALHLSAGQQYSALAGDWAPQGSALGSWKNDAQTFGLLASLNWQRRGSRRDGLETFADNNLYTITDDQGTVTDKVYAVWGGGSAMLEQERRHTTSNLTAQWAPDARWDLALNLLRSQMDIDNRNHNFLFSPGGYKLSETPAVTVTDPEYLTSDDGHKILAGGTLGNPDSVGAILDSIQRQAYIDTAVNDMDIRHRGERWENHVQFGHTSARGGTSHDRLYRFTGNSRVRFHLDRNILEAEYLDLDPQNPAALDHLSPLSRDWVRAMDSREHYAQWDLERDFGDGWLQHARFGLKYRNHRVENNLTVGEIDTESAAWQTLQNIGLDQVSGGLSPSLSDQSASADTLVRYALTDAALLQSVINPLFDDGAMRYRYDRSAYFSIREQSLAAYASIDFEAGAWAGNAGVRGVGTRQRASAYDRDQLHHADNRYRDLLPSVNLQYRMDEGLLARVGIAQVMARPNFKDLTPNIIVEPTSGYGAAGNPQLEPYRADQLDLALEWYFADASLLSATAFYKDISTFVYPHVNPEMIDGELHYITRPQNGPGATIRGLELQWQQGFSGNVGILSNYTYTDASVPSADGSRTLELPGNSRSQFNASLYFENPRLDARLSYNYRSRSYGEIIAGSQSETAAYQQWDATAQWRWSETLAFSAEAINLTDEVIRIHSAAGIPQGLYENGRRFAVGVKMEF
ncbi:TonB-dependent receptor [Microbulbifer harenosus]|uniref:TonB-dependent receptor n=1 Tax=Microbulbifer harenosus TaxID=2576840 RepID=A0ABY2UGC6_9GAMM|nr:TonB-dependent receptor [Microbulbifer harenosus]TLM76713.1 TonB-dependent receptor [Microbulbifer harenosus]